MTDRTRASVPLPELAQRAVDGGVDVIQIREKDLSAGELAALTDRVLERVGDRSRIVVNGALTVAAELGVGIHLPESGTSPVEARRVLGPDALIGRSVHAPESAANSNEADYVIAGHIFATASKPGMPPIGLEGLRSVVEAATVPVLAVGGITAHHVRPVLGVGAYGVAVLSAINAASDPAWAARLIRDELDRGIRTMMPATVGTIDLTVNGKPVALESGTTVQRFLESKDYHERLVVVELNGVILPRSAFVSTVLSAGDRVEVVHFVGGG